MATGTFDTQKLQDTLMKGSLSEGQSGAIFRGMKIAFSEALADVATKEDLKREIARLEAKFEGRFETIIRLFMIGNCFYKETCW